MKLNGNAALKRRAHTALMFVSLILCASASLRETHAAEVKPNILWIIGEDFGQHLGCYGCKDVQTPNLDALAAKGQRFTRFFTTNPICSPSRSAFMTGMYQTTIGAHQHRTAEADKKPLPDGVRLMTDWLRDAGYFTSNIVKFPEAVDFQGRGKTDFNFKYDGKPFDSASWDEMKAHQPFYGQVNFQETHRDFHAPQKADPATLEIPPYYPDHPVVREDWAKYLDSAMELDRKVGEVLKQLERDGLADSTIVVFFGDNGQAQVRGKQFCYDSGLLVPFLLYWPAKLHPPQDYKAGSVSDRLLPAIDLTAQTLDWAGVKKPAAMQGQVFMGPKGEPARELVFGARDRADKTTFRFRTVRDAQYRYIKNFTPDRPMMLRSDYKATQYPAWNLIKKLGREGKLTNDAQRFLVAPTMPEEELYDTIADPHETVNLATSSKPEHQAALLKLREAVAMWIVESKDQGQFDDYSYDKAWAAEGDKIGPQY
jgi:arylsulfatase A-like enzyme